MSSTPETELQTLESELYGDAPAEPTAEKEENEPVMSKNQCKKLAKMERFQELKRKRKETEKAERKEKKQRLAEEKSEMFSSMTEEELAKYKEATRAKVDAQKKAEANVKEKLREAVASGPRVVIDLDFDDLMVENDKRHLCQQLAFSYAVNKSSSSPCHLLLTSFKGNLETMAKQIVSGIDNWICTRTPLPYHEFLKDEREKIVYLTADSENEVEELDPSKVYVIGGIVDHNRHKNLCYKRASELGISTARLPINKHVQLATSAVLTVNHVFSLLVGFYGSRDWSEVLERVLPQRKRADFLTEHGSKRIRRQANWEKKAEDNGKEDAAAEPAEEEKKEEEPVEAEKKEEEPVEAEKKEEEPVEAEKKEEASADD